MIRHFLTPQFLKFLFVGGSAALVNWVVRIFFSMWLSFSLAVIAAYLVGMSVAFILNKIYVFPQSTRKTSKQMRDFTITNLIAFPLVWIFSITLKALFLHFGMTFYVEEISHFIALSIPMVVSFLIYKFIAFK